MRLFRRPAATPLAALPDEEDPVVRQYRYFLRTAPGDALEHAHLEALGVLSPQDRAAVLRTVQEQLVAGLRLEPDDVPALARLVVLGERRSPGALLRHCPAEPLRRLADAALVSEAAFGLLSGYAAWDGLDPEPSPDEDWQARKHRNWGDPSDSPEVRKAWSSGTIGTSGAGGFGGGDAGG
ncbi:MAG TPA: hypothetical protein VFG97_03725 [Pedococcus sp.]|nr:hypothetical protein [Pedococcus sp.]